MPKNEPIDLARLREDLQRANAPWQMSYTSITALSEEEREILLGVPPSPGLDVEDLEQDREVAATAAQEARAADVGAPVRFDLRNVGGVNYSTPVKNQASCGSCVAFGVAATMEGVARFTRARAPCRSTCRRRTSSTVTAVPPALAATPDGGRQQALNASRTTGITFEDYYPYTAGDQDCTGLNADWPNRVAKVTNWAFLNGNAANMKQYISTYGAIEACMDVYQDFFSYSSGIYRHISGSYAGGHCVCLIGYDDAAGCWIAKNSWGTSWGQAGYFQIAYGDCRIETYLQPGGSGASGVQGVSLRAWLPNQLILGLWNNEYENNTWAYGLRPRMAQARQRRTDHGRGDAARAGRRQGRKPAGGAVREQRHRRADLRMVTTPDHEEDEMARTTPTKAPPKARAEDSSSVAVGTTEPELLTEETLAEALEAEAEAQGRPTLDPTSTGGATVQAEAIGAVTGTWQTGKTVTALWSINEIRNAWMYVSGVGWRKLYNGRDGAFRALVTLAAHARQTGRPINFREEADGMVYEIYSW